MNKIVTLEETRFCKSLSHMKFADKESLQRLLLRELALENEELVRYRGLLKLSLDKKNKLDYLKYEQLIKENELHVKKLEQKLNICQNEIDKEISTNGLSTTKVKESKLATGTVNKLRLDQKLSSFNNIEHSDIITSPINTKSLINNFERIGVAPTENNIPPKPSHNPIMTNIKSVKNGKLTAPGKKTKPFVKTEETPILFTEIKLKKIGLPPDAKDVYQNNPLIEQVPIVNNQNLQNRKVSLPTSFPRSPSIDLDSMPNNQNKMDKFLNPNKEIQIAIQKEIKGLKLKKVCDSIPQPVVNCSIDNISLGRYNFVNEKSITTSKYSVPISTCKSMPFLNSINAQNFNLDHTDSISTSIPSVQEQSECDSGTTNKLVSSTISNWNPSSIVKELYNFEEQLNEDKILPRTDVKKLSGFIEVLPGLSNNSWNTNLWKRRFANISKGELKIFESQTSQSPIVTFEIKKIATKKATDETIDLYDSKGLHSTIKFSKSADCSQWLDALKSHLSYKTSEVVPRFHDSISSSDVPKILIVDIGSCSIRAGLLRNQPSFPKLYFPHIAALNKTSETVIEIGFEAVCSSSNDLYNIVRPLKPDTTLEHFAFTSGTIEFTFKRICLSLNINPEDYVVMLSLPHNVTEVSRTKLMDVLLLRLNFQGVSMRGQALLGLQAYGEPTGILIDIGHRTEIIPVIHGVVQNAAIMRSLYGGHLIQIALSHLLPFPVTSLTDFLLVRYIMEKACYVAKNEEKAKHSGENISVNLENCNLPPEIPRSISLSGTDRTLPVEGLFNPDIYSLDALSLPKLIVKSIQSCPVDNRRDLCQSIFLSGAATQFNGLQERLEMELKNLLPKTCDVKVYCSPNRAHFSYVGACFVALSEGFKRTIVNRRQWEESRNIVTRKWHM